MRDERILKASESQLIECWGLSSVLRSMTFERQVGPGALMAGNLVTLVFTVIYDTNPKQGMSGT